MSYTDSGFNQYFNRDPFKSIREDSEEFTPFDRQLTEQGFSADQIIGGILRSPNSNFSLNMEDGYLSVVDNGIEIIRIGMIESGVYGLLITSFDGKQIMKITSSQNFIQSPDGNTIVDFDNNRIVISENGVPRVLLGKGEF